jgi:hypothetical protein
VCHCIILRKEKCDRSNALSYNLDFYFKNSYLKFLLVLFQRININQNNNPINSKSFWFLIIFFLKINKKTYISLLYIFPHNLFFFKKKKKVIEINKCNQCIVFYFENKMKNNILIKHFSPFKFFFLTCIKLKSY